MWDLVGVFYVMEAGPRAVDTGSGVPSALAGVLGELSVLDDDDRFLVFAGGGGVRGWRS